MATPLKPEPRPAHSPLPGMLILFTLVTIVFCLGNQSLPLIDRDEPRFSEAAREMLQKNEWVVPTFNAKPRYDKPPLIYWMQIGCYRALGDNEFAARLPAAVCTGLTAVILALWGTRLASRATGFTAAIIFTTCVQVFVHGRAAVADPPMVLFSLLAAWAGWEWLRQPSRTSLALGFWVSLALGFLAKGPIAWVPIGMLGWAAWKSKRAGEATAETTLPSAGAWTLGALLMLALVCLWGVPALLRTKGDFASVGLGEHVVGRSFVSMEGHGAKNFLGYLASLPFYFLTVFPSFAPWSFWLPAAWRAHWRKPTPESAYLMSGVILTFVIFTLSRTKLPHYTLPAFPFLALLLALWWRENRPAALCLRTAKITAAVFIFVPLFIFPLVKKLSVTESLMTQLRPQLDPATEVALVEFEEPSLIWNLRKVVRGYPQGISKTDVAAWLSKPGPRVCILTTAAENEYAASAGNFPAPAIQRIAAEGWNFAKGRKLTLVALSRGQHP